MERIFALLVIASLTILAFPATSAAEEVTEEYFITAGARIAGYGTTPSWRPCPSYSDNCDLDEDGTNDIPDVIKMGGGPLKASQFYTNVIIRVNDEIYGSAAATQACFWNPEGVTTNICEGENAGGEDYLSDTVCGTLALLGSPYPGDRVTVWVYTLVVTEDLSSICGGFSGTMTGDFF